MLSFPQIKPGPSQKRKIPISTPAPAPTSTPTAHVDSDTEEDIKPTKKARKSGTVTGGAGAMGMSPDVKEALVEHIFRLGHAAMQKDELAAEVSLTTTLTERYPVPY